jgi:hypothetical protein
MRAGRVAVQFERLGPPASLSSVVLRQMLLVIFPSSRHHREFIQHSAYVDSPNEGGLVWHFGLLYAQGLFQSFL